MRVRPATPLSIILLAAFALLLLSVLSTPIIPGIHLAAYNDVTFGVFGFCTSGQCSGYAIGYNTASGELSNADFSLQSNARNSLTHLLIVHPIAALFTLILLILSVLSHLNGPAHSPRYLLAILILSLPTFVLSLLAFLVDILIFLPHVQWGGWVVLGATVLNAIAGIITCGMRRTLVQKVARRKRIAEAPPTNGTEFYANQPQVAAVPPIPESNMGDKMPEFATFEVDKPVHGEPEGEHIPLNPRSRAMPPSAPEERVMGGASSFNQPSLRRAPSDRSEGYGPPPRGAGPLSRPNPPGQVRGQYPNQLVQSANNGNPGPYGAPPPRGYGSPAPGYNGDGYNGRPPQGGYRGPPPQNGPGVFNPGTGLGPPPRRGPGPNQFGSRGPPPQNGGPYGGGGQYGMGPGMGMAHHRRPIEQQPPPQHQPQRESREYDFPAEQPHVDERREFEQTLPAAAGGTAVGIAAAAPAPAQATNERYRDDDRRVQPAELAADMQREPTPPRLAVVNDTRQLYDNEYVPPRSVWNGQSSGTPPPQSRTPPPAELPTDADASPARRGNNAAPRPSESYYEDVAPVFDATHVAHSQSPHPHAPMPGGMPGPVPYRIHIPQQQQQQQQQQMQLRTLEDLQDGQRSPAMSTTSNFTSISQRPPNPNWVPGPGQPPMPGGMNQGRRGPTSSQLLGGNPDFELPTGRGGRFRGGAGMGR